MITLQNNEANTIITYYDAPEQYFLFEFKSGINCQPIYLLPENVSACDDYQKFVINRNFGFGGVWTVSIYNQSSPTNTNPANATLLATEQATIIIDDDCFNTPPVIIDPCPQINPADFSCEELLTPYTGLTETQIECILATLSCEYLREVLTYEQIECFGPPLSGYTCEQLLEGLTESQLSCLLRSFDCDFLNDPYLGLTRNQLACLPDKPIDLHTCEELLDPYTGLTNSQKSCVLQDLGCDLLNDRYTGLSDEQRSCIIQNATCEELTDPYTGLTETQQICVMQALPCGLLADQYNGLSDIQKSCILQSLDCEFLTDPILGLTEEQIRCFNPYTNEYELLLAVSAALGYGAPSDNVKEWQDQLIRDGKNNGWWDLLDVFYVRVNDASAGFSTLNWKSPGAHTTIFTGGVNWVSNGGVTLNGINGFMRNQWNSQTNAVNFQLNNSLMISLCNINTAGATIQPIFYQSANASVSVVQIYSDSGFYYSRFNNVGAELDTPATPGKRLRGFRRVSNTQYTVFDNLTETVEVNSSTSLSGGDLVEGVLSTLYGTGTFYVSAAGSGSINVTTMLNDLNNYLANFGL